MKIALLTNSKLSIPAIEFLASNKLLAGIGLPAREDKTEDADHIQYIATSYNIPVVVFQKISLAQDLTEWLMACKSDVVFVFTFPFKIPASVLNIPTKGFINFHFGLLPQYRGADAIFWQIRNGEKQGGISVHQMTPYIDKGPLYLIHTVPIFPQDTYGSHLLNLSLAAVNVVQGMRQLLQNPQPALNFQNESLAVYYSRPTLKDVTIDWEHSAANILALINATNPWNKGAVTYMHRHPVKIISASLTTGSIPTSFDAKPGTILVADQILGCKVCCGIREILNLDILYCNDSFITGIQFVQLGITSGLRFEKPSQANVA